MSADWWPWLAVGLMFVALQLYKRAGQISGEEAKRLVSQGALLIDVRSPAEFSYAHLPGATNVPAGELPSKVDSLGAKDRPVVVYCASGTRSAMARSMLKSRGFTQVFNLGAMHRWG